MRIPGRSVAMNTSRLSQSANHFRKEQPDKHDFKRRTEKDTIDLCKTGLESRRTRWALMWFMAKGYLGQGLPPAGPTWVSDFMNGMSRHAHELCRQLLVLVALARYTRGLTPERLPTEARAGSSRLNSPRPRDVRRLGPALPLLVRLQGHVAHDVPLPLL